MKGKHKIVVKNNRLHYEFEIKRNITIIKGDSATGKTTLINMIRHLQTLVMQAELKSNVMPRAQFLREICGRCCSKIYQEISFLLMKKISL